MEKASRASTWWHYVAALPLMLLSLGLGNVLGIVFASISGWENFEIGRPGGVALGFLQGLVGAIIASASGNRLFKSIQPIDFCLKAFVLIAVILLAVLVAFAIVLGNFEIVLKWSTAAGIAGIIGTEVGRRAGREEFL